MASGAIGPLLKRLAGQGKKGKKITLTEEQAEDALNVLKTLSSNPQTLGVLAGNGGLAVLTSFVQSKSNRKNIGALTPCYYVLARMVGSTPELSNEAVSLGLVQSAADVVHPNHKRADLPFKRAGMAFLWSMASYPEHRETVGLSGCIYGASYLLMFGGKLHRDEVRGRKKKNLENAMRASAFVKKKVQENGDNSKKERDPLPANSESEQLACGLLWYCANGSSNRLMVVRAEGYKPICDILRRESVVKKYGNVNRGSKESMEISKDVVVRLKKSDNRIKGFDERTFRLEDEKAAKHSMFSSAEYCCGVVWNLLADSIAQQAVLEERGPYLLCLYSESTVDEDAPSRSNLVDRWSSPEKSLAHLSLLFPGKSKDILMDNQEKAKKTAEVMKIANNMKPPTDDEVEENYDHYSTVRK
jgi:hypothetical protein